VAETSYPTAGGGSVTDTRYEALMARLAGAGMLGAPTLSPLVFADSSGRQIRVAPSRSAMVRGFRWEIDAAGLTWPIDANTSGQPRIDLAVLRLSRGSGFAVRFAVVKGSPAVVPTAPAATQQEGGSGVWELPVALIRVASNTGAGLPVLIPTDVTALESYLGPQPVACHSTRRPAVQFGLLISEYDTGKTLIGTSNGWLVLTEFGSFISVPGTAGWSSSTTTLRRNGFVYTRFEFIRTGATGSLGDTLLTLPATHCPPHYIDIVGLSRVGTALTPQRVSVYPTGQVVHAFGSPIPQNADIAFGTCVWPASA